MHARLRILFGAEERSAFGALDPEEPANVARMAAEMGLRYVVITSVNRDDLGDGGSRHFAATVHEVKRALPDARVEVLTPDFCGDLDAVARVLDAGPHVFNHNMETVARLYKRVRPQADYRQSLDVLRFAKQYRPESLTKSGRWLGWAKLPKRSRSCCAICGMRMWTLLRWGNIYSPRGGICGSNEYVTPEQFDVYRDFGLSIGFKMVFSGPLVRSSYMADVVSADL